MVDEIGAVNGSTTTTKQETQAKTQQKNAVDVLEREKMDDGLSEFGMQ